MRFKTKNQDYLMFVIVIVIFLLVPFLLNFILPITTPIPVIGDAKIWLSFWGTYIGSILTAVLVFGTFLTIRKTVNINKTQWKIDWLNKYRETASELLQLTNVSEVNQISQDIFFGRYKEAVDSGQRINNLLRKNSFLLSSLFKEYDNIFEKKTGDKYSHIIQETFQPYKQYVGEIIQFANICQYLKEKIKDGHYDEAKNAFSDMKQEMQKAKYTIIEQFIEGIENENIDNEIHDAVVKLQKQFSSFKSLELEKVLLQISETNAKTTYSYCFFIHSNGKILGKKDHLFTF